MQDGTREMLRVEFAELADDGFNLELTGFDLVEIKALDFEESGSANANSCKWR